MVLTKRHVLLSRRREGGGMARGEDFIVELQRKTGGGRMVQCAKPESEVRGVGREMEEGF
jgi:hypothetical protein